MTSKKKFYSKWKNVEATLKQMYDELGHFPREIDLHEAKRWTLSVCLRNFGGLAKVRERMGFDQCRKPDGFWGDKGKVSLALKKIIKKLGRFPTKEDCRTLKCTYLPVAVKKHYGSLNNAREKFGLPPGTRSNGYWKDWENVKRELEPLIEECVDFPSHVMIQERLGKGFKTAVHDYHGGMVAVKKKLGFDTKKPNGYWHSEENILKELKEVMELHGLEKIPGMHTLDKLGHATLGMSISKVIGYKKLRESFGEEMPVEPGTWKDLEYTIDQAKEVMKSEAWDVLPGGWTLQKKGYNSLATAITEYHGGYPAFREHLGKPLVIKDWSDEDFAIDEAIEFMDEHGFERLPSSAIMQDLGYSSLSSSIYKYHGKIKRFRELLRKRRQEMSDKDQLEIILDDYIGDSMDSDDSRKMDRD